LVLSSAAMETWEVFCWCLAGVVGTSSVSFYVTSSWPLYRSGRKVDAQEQTLTQRLEATDRLALFPYLVAVNALALASVRPAFGTFEERWFGGGEANRWCMALYCTKTGFDTVTHAFTLGQPDAKSADMLVHHVVSVIAVGLGLFSGHCRFFASLAIVSEVSTIFLNFLMAVKLFTGERTKRHKRLVLINGIFLWLSYLACRLFVFPFWLWLYFSDLATYDVSRVSWIVLVVYPVSTFTMLVLSVHWFFRITKGILKAVVTTKDP